MTIDIVTLFPQVALAPLSDSIIKRAQEKGQVEIRGHQLRDWAEGKHLKTDDYLCGGGQGMLLMPAPIFAAVRELKQRALEEGRTVPKVVLMTPQGVSFKQSLAQSLSREYSLIILCGHYEGVDERVRYLVTQEVSLGDFVLTCGEIPALALINGVVRLLPGTVGKEQSLKAESFEDGLLDYPQYTRPAEFRGWQVPDILRSGNHREIEGWRREQQINRTRERRPDLWEKWLKGLRS